MRVSWLRRALKDLEDAKAFIARDGRSGYAVWANPTYGVLHFALSGVCHLYRQI